ncbi:MAG: MFS transporter [Candidatus Lindowbacteria bacterium]|nr:MFS transporter [Candidatus Lindowbacteria bacterium]
MSDAGGQRVFYGWWIVTASFIIIFFGAGIGFYSFSVFIKPLEAEFGWSRGLISSSVAVWAVVYGFSTPLIGVFLHKYGPRAVISVAAFIAGVCYLAFGWLQQLPQLFILMFFTGIGMAGITLLPNQTVISNWFQKYRGRAMGIMMMGVGFGGSVMPPVANALIDSAGWRTSFRILGLLLLVVIIPVAFFILRTKPHEMGLQPDGAGSPHGADASTSVGPVLSEAGLSVKRAVRTRSFWLVFVAFMLLIFGESGLAVHFVASVDDAGLSSQTAANYWGLLVGTSAFGRLGFGLLADRWNQKRLLVLTHGFHAVALALLVVFFISLGIHSWVILFPFAILYGLSLGGAAVVLPILVARCFGMVNFSKLLGLLMSGFALGVVGGPVVAGKINDATGSYRLAFMIFTTAFALSAFMVSFVQPDKYKGEFSNP